VKRFDFGRADVDGIAQLAAVDWYALFLGLGIDDCFEKLNVLIVLFLSTKVLTRRTGSTGWIKSFVRTKSHKYMKELGKIYIRPKIS
jgi:hypothetical protein